MMKAEVQNVLSPLRRLPFEVLVKIIWVFVFVDTHVILLIHDCKRMEHSIALLVFFMQ